MIVEAEHTRLEQARAGDLNAFAELCAGLEMPLRRFTRRLIGVSSLEDDILQNVFIALYVNLERLDSGEKLRPFVFRVVRNQCYDELRSQGRYEILSLEDENRETETSVIADESAQPPEEATHWTLLYQQVHAAVQSLPEVQRQVILLYIEGGLAYEEIAEAMNTSVGTVKSRLYHARLNLARRLPPETLEALRGDGQDEV